MYTIFNKNKIKISYSCFPNMGSIISGLARKKKAGVWSPLTFFNPRQRVSFR